MTYNTTARRNIAIPCNSTNLESAALQTGKHLAGAVEWKKNKYRGSFPTTHSLFPLAMLACGELGPKVRVVIKELAYYLELQLKDSL